MTERDRERAGAHLLGPLRQVLIDAVVARVKLAAREPSHVPGLKAALGHAVEVSEPLQGGLGSVAPKLVWLVEALLVHRLFGNAIGGGYFAHHESVEESRSKMDVLRSNFVATLVRVDANICMCVFMCVFIVSCENHARSRSLARMRRHRLGCAAGIRSNANNATGAEKTGGNEYCCDPQRGHRAAHLVRLHAIRNRIRRRVCLHLLLLTHAGRERQSRRHGGASRLPKRTCGRSNVEAGAEVKPDETLQ